LPVTLGFKHKLEYFMELWRATWNQLAGRMRPAGRGLDSTGLIEQKWL